MFPELAACITQAVTHFKLAVLLERPATPPRNGPLVLSEGPVGKELRSLAAELMADLKANSENRTMRFSHDTLTVQCIFPKRSKSIIDRIDSALAKHYGFTAEELDFLANYDIKYRMGTDTEGDEE